MQPRHMTVCVLYVSLNKASLKGNTACTMETGVAMERMLLVDSKRNEGLIPPLTCLKKKKKIHNTQV